MSPYVTLAATSLKARASTWLGAFIMLSAASVVVAVVASQLETAVSIPDEAGDVVRGYSLPMGLLAFTVTAIVLPSVLARTVSVQLREYALLRLAGATPRQVRGVLTVQLVLLTLLALPMGLLVGYPASNLFFRYTADQSAQLLGRDLVYGVMTIAATTFVVVVFALIAGLRAAKAAAQAPILAAILDEMPPQRTGRARRVARWLVATVATATVAIIVVVSLQLPEGAISATVLNVLGLGALALMAATLATAAMASAILPGLTGLWTKLVPGRSPTWLLARRAVQAQLSRTSSGVLPLFVSLSLVAGVFSLLWTADAAFIAAGRIGEGQSATNVGGVLLILCGGLFVAGTGAVVAILIANRNREQEYATRRAIGETQRGTVLSAVAEAVIFVVSSAILAGLVVATVVSLTTVSLAHYVGPILMRFEIGMPAGIALVGLFLVTFALMPPAVRSASSRDIVAVLSRD